MSLNQKETSSQDLFINGKSQIIEMLKCMSSFEKEKLLKNVRIKNPQLAVELGQDSFTFDDLDKLNDQNLSLVFSRVQPIVLGLALKETPKEFQKRMLILAPRSYAEEVYQTLTIRVKNEKRDIPRAQKKIVSILAPLIKV